MKDIHGVALRAGARRFEILDQTRLPDAEVWLDGSDPEAMVGHIQRLSVRGAPLIGVAASLSVAAFAERGADRSALHTAIDRLRRARPTAVNLAWAMDRLGAVVDAGGSAADLIREAEAIHDEDVAACERMGDLGADLIRAGEQLLTHCNAGALATAGIGSALGVIHRAHARGRGIHVWVNETRPLLQGARLTAWELGRLGVPYTIVDRRHGRRAVSRGQGEPGHRRRRPRARNGDFANKVGTYPRRGPRPGARRAVPPVAPLVDGRSALPLGDAIPIEQRAPEEVAWRTRRPVGAGRARVFNPAFDVTPVSLVTSLITERGVFDGERLAAGELARLA